jgi:hypothetical protein
MKFIVLNLINVFKKKTIDDGVRVMDLQYGSSLVALSGPEEKSMIPSYSVYLADASQESNDAIFSRKFLFSSQVLNVKLRTDRLIVIVETKIHGFFLSTFRPDFTLETYSNPLGLCGISTGFTPFLLCCLGSKQGKCLLYNALPKPSIEFQAHTSGISAIGLGPENTTVCATSNRKGSLIRTFDINTGQCLQEVRRGTDTAIIHSISFNFDASSFGCTSDKGTIHIFSRDSSQNRKSTFRFMHQLLPTYFASEWSHTQLRIPNKKSFLFFTKKLLLYILCDNGHLIQCHLGESDPPMIILEPTKKST